MLSSLLVVLKPTMETHEGGFTSPHEMHKAVLYSKSLNPNFLFDIEI